MSGLEITRPIYFSEAIKLYNPFLELSSNLLLMRLDSSKNSANVWTESAQSDCSNKFRTVSFHALILWNSKRSLLCSKIFAQNFLRFLMIILELCVGPGLSLRPELPCFSWTLSRNVVCYFIFIPSARSNISSIILFSVLLWNKKLQSSCFTKCHNEKIIFVVSKMAFLICNYIHNASTRFY